MDLPGTLVFDYPTVAAITDFIAAKLAPQAAAVALPALPPAGYGPQAADQMEPDQYACLLVTPANRPGHRAGGKHTLLPG